MRSTRRGGVHPIPIFRLDMCILKATLADRQPSPLPQVFPNARPKPKNLGAAHWRPRLFTGGTRRLESQALETVEPQFPARTLERFLQEFLHGSGVGANRAVYFRPINMVSVSRGDSMKPCLA